MSDERAQGRGWARIPASRAEQPGTTRAAPPPPYGQPPYAQDPYPHAHGRHAQAPHAQTPHTQAPHEQTPYAQAQHAQAPYDPSMIYLSLVKRWQEAGRTLPGHPDEEWERLISQPCWPGR
ncbi:hypothetical protein [Streptomyces sp. NBC_01244]|uniref:hypothetical protein n=1 Tax=Streptomyces sp. NBC_01244 TaxID=2903797 RepID=UPI002E0D7E96|nr:hypothetical protein OG247_18040 [Streptomyces sp. NBC_01244]